MDPSNISSSRPPSPALIEPNLTDSPSSGPQDDPQGLMRTQPMTEELQRSPSLADHTPSDWIQPPIPEASLQSCTQQLTLTADESVEYAEWLARVKNPHFTDEERLALIPSIPNATIKLQLLYAMAKGLIIIEPKLRLQAARTIQKRVNFIEQQEPIDCDTLKLYLSLKNQAYCALAMDPTIKDGELILEAIDAIGDYDLKKAAFQRFAGNESLDEAFKQDALLAIAQNPEKEDYYRFWAATWVLDGPTRDHALYTIAVKDSERVSESIIMKAAESIQCQDTKDGAFISIALDEELGRACGIEALEAIKNTDKKEKTCIQITRDERFDMEYRLEATKHIQDDTKKEEALLALIGLEAPIYSHDLQLKLAACEAIPNCQKYLNLRQEILKKFFSQSLEPDETGQETMLSSKCRWIVSFFEASLQKGYVDANREEQAILLQGFVRYLGVFCAHTSLQKITTLIQGLYEATMDAAIKKDFVYTILQCNNLQNPQHKFTIYTCALKLALPTTTICNDAIQDLMDKVLSTAACSPELCTALIHYMKGILCIAPFMREVMVYCILDNTYLDKDFRINIVKKLSNLDEEEREKLLQAIETGKDTRRFKRMKVSHNDD